MASLISDVHLYRAEIRFYGFPEGYVGILISCRVYPSFLSVSKSITIFALICNLPLIRLLIYNAIMLMPFPFS